MISDAGSPAHIASPDTRPSLMSIHEAIFNRRSVRDYVGQVSRQQVTDLLEAAIRAPTARHQEPWAFVVIQDPRELDRLSAQAVDLLAAEAPHTRPAGQRAGGRAALESGSSIFHNAGTLIAICAQIQLPFAQADCWLAAENLMLAAYARGLGTCVIGSACAVLNLPENRARLGIPVNVEAIAPIILGKPATPAHASTRHPPRVLAWLAGGQATR